MKKATTGFSLLELIVVVFLVALLSTVAVLRLGVGQGIVVQSEARQFAQRLNLLMDEGLLSGQIYRIVVDIEEQTYEYQHFQNGWNSISEKPFGKKLMPATVAFEMDVKQEGQVNGTESINNFVVQINSDGTATPFEMRFGERAKKNAIDEESSIWLIQGGQSVALEQEGIE